MNNDFPIYLIGSGGHAKVLIDSILESNWKINGLLDNNIHKHGQELMGIPILGGDEYLHKNHVSINAKIVIAIGSTRSTKKRGDIYKQFKDRNFKFLNIIHKQSIISNFAILKESVQVLAGAIINAGSTIGENSIINTGAIIDHDCTIGQNVHIAPGVTLSGNVIIGDNSHIGIGSMIIQGIEIGRECLIGAGSVVVSNIPNNCMAIGCPAKVIRTI
jgi:sugar O-acyltransferase (sialic acid O-acetyltransferase NeuD family)